MKSSAIAYIGIAVFVGAFAALQIDHYMDRKRSVGDLSLINDAKNGLVRTVDYTEGAGGPDFRSAAKKVNQSVVSVDRYQRVRRGFFDDEGVVTETGTGSGVIVSRDGVIVTNNHVVQDATNVRVRIQGRQPIMAKVLGTDPRSDLAVLKVDANDLSPIELGKSSDVEVGQWVMAVGNPLEFDNTVSVGVVSSVKRDLPMGAGGLVNAIQTDAAINPGNSGGALTDTAGHLIGINSAIASGTGQSVGIGFAIPVDRVRTVVNDIIKFGYAKYAGLGFSPETRLDGALADPDIRAQLADLVQADNPPSTGIIVRKQPNGVSELKQWDVILSVDDQPTDRIFALNKTLMTHKPGDSVSVKIWRSGSEKTVTVNLVEMKG